MGKSRFVAKDPAAIAQGECEADAGPLIRIPEREHQPLKDLLPPRKLGHEVIAKLVFRSLVCFSEPSSALQPSAFPVGHCRLGCSVPSGHSARGRCWARPCDLTISIPWNRVRGMKK